MSEYFLKYRFSPNKKFGQNFLINPKVIEDFVKTANVKDNTILEIGPGTGFITEELLKHAKKVVCIEIDEKLINVLNDKFANEISKKKLKIINADVLAIDLNKIVKTEKIDKIVSAPPYYISTDIMYAILPLEIKQAHLIFQEDFIYKLESTDFFSPSALSIILNYYTKLNLGSTLQPNAFFPTPKIKSKIISLDYKNNLPFTKRQEQQFIYLIKEIYRYSGKGLRKALILTLKNTESKSLGEKLIDALESNSKLLDLKIIEISSKEYIKFFKNIL